MSNLAIFAAFVAGPALAQPAPAPSAGAASPAIVAVVPPSGHKASAKAVQLVSLMNVDASLDRTFAAITPMVGAVVVTSLEANEKTRPYVEKMFGQLPGGRARLAVLVVEEFTKGIRQRYPELEERLAAFYDANFTPAELDGMIGFYSSGAGRKMLLLQPALAKQLQEIGEGVGRAVGEKAGFAAFHRAEIEAGMPTDDTPTT